MKKILLLIVLLLAPLAASAQTVAPKQLRKNYYSATGTRKLLSGIALNAASGTRTVTLTTADFAQVVWQVNLTRVAAITIVLTCTGSIDGGTTYGNMNSVAVSAGAATLSTLVWTKTVSATTKELVAMDVQALDKIQCVFSGASGGASDLVDVYAIALAGA